MHMLAARGMTVLLVEQNAMVGLKNAALGRRARPRPHALRRPGGGDPADPRIQELYLGKATSAA